MLIHAHHPVVTMWTSRQVHRKSTFKDPFRLGVFSVSVYWTCKSCLSFKSWVAPSLLAHVLYPPACWIYFHAHHPVGVLLNLYFEHVNDFWVSEFGCYLVCCILQVPLSRIRSATLESVPTTATCASIAMAGIVYVCRCICLPYLLVVSARRRVYLLVDTHA